MSMTVVRSHMSMIIIVMDILCDFVNQKF